MFSGICSELDETEGEKWKMIFLPFLHNVFEYLGQWGKKDKRGKILFFAGKFDSENSFFSRFVDSGKNFVKDGNPISSLSPGTCTFN